MKGKFTKKLLTFIFVFSLGFFMNSSMVSAQNCDVPVGLNTSSISNFSATLNWDLDANVDHYRLRYRRTDLQAGCMNTMLLELVLMLLV